MVVKERVGRNRYIAFRIEGGEDLQAGEVKAALTEASWHEPKEARPWLVRFRTGAGIVRVSHLHKDTALRLLRSLQRIAARRVTVRTLGTTGTVRRAIRKYLEPPDP
ncbi:MAG: Rpp14/Pop5 family protein [Thermoplasmata archaeon]